jgi:opacity protein-like surface antigen
MNFGLPYRCVNEQPWGRPREVFMQVRIVTYLVCVLSLVVCCAAQTADTQAAKDVSYESAQLVPSQGSSQPLTLPLGTDESTICCQTPSGQTTGTSGQKKKSDQEPDWEWATGVSAGIGYSSTSGNPGIGGFNVGAGWRFKEQIELATDIDIGSETTILGGVTSKSKRQNYLFGGRYYIAKAITRHNKVVPFGHLLYGVTHESVKATQGIPVTTTVSTAQTAWSWDFGGGVDYLLTPHWALRGRADWLKTHFNNSSQSHFKWVAGFWYSFSARQPLPPK